MKLTKYMREAFVNAAMNDVPTVDYEEQLKKEVLRASVDALPSTVRLVWKDESTKQYIKTAYRHYAGQSILVPGFDGDSWSMKPPLPALLAADKVLIDNLAAQCKAQTEQRTTLRRQLKSVAEGCNTRKQLAEALPEFAKYLPADTPAACKTLPAIADVMTDFVKAGWPKEKK